MNSFYLSLNANANSSSENDYNNNLNNLVLNKNFLKQYQQQQLLQQQKSLNIQSLLLNQQQQQLDTNMKNKILTVNGNNAENTYESALLNLKSYMNTSGSGLSSRQDISAKHLDLNNNNLVTDQSLNDRKLLELLNKLQEQSNQIKTPSQESSLSSKYLDEQQQQAFYAKQMEKLLALNNQQVNYQSTLVKPLNSKIKTSFNFDNSSQQINNLIQDKLYLNQQQQQANQLIEQQELTKKILERKRQEEQYQEFKNMKQLQMLQQQQQQQKYEPVSKEYILSKLKAQKETQKLYQMQQQQLKQIIQEQYYEQNFLDQQQQQQHDISLLNTTTQYLSEKNTSQAIKASLHQNDTPTIPTIQHQQQAKTKIDPIEKLKLLLIKNNQLNAQQPSNKANIHDPNANSKPLIPNYINQQNVTPLNSSSTNLKSNQVEISSEGFIKNIPSNMLVDQYGMLGLAMMYKHNEMHKLNPQNELDKNISVIIGKDDSVKDLLKNVKEDLSLMDQKAMDMNEPSTELTYHLRKFSSNAAQQLPPEYRISQSRIKDKLVDANELMRQTSNDDLLFYLFYMCCKDEMQVRAYDLLCERNWIYNKEMKTWFKLMSTDVSSSFSSSGSNSSTSTLSEQYYMFDVASWQIKKLNVN